VYFLGSFYIHAPIFLKQFVVGLLQYLLKMECFVAIFLSLDFSLICDSIVMRNLPYLDGKIMFR
jgi:hypothetical protein